jgi:hypothetical protein
VEAYPAYPVRWGRQLQKICVIRGKEIGNVFTHTNLCKSSNNVSSGQAEKTSQRFGFAARISLSQTFGMFLVFYPKRWLNNINLDINNLKV